MAPVSTPPKALSKFDLGNLTRRRNNLYNFQYYAIVHPNLGSPIPQVGDFRGMKLTNVRGEFAAKEPRYKKLWGPRLSGQMVASPEFNEVYRSVRRALRQAGLTGT